MGFLWTILLGLVVGVIARLIHPGRENMGIIMTILLGMAGAFLAGIIGQWIGWWEVGTWVGFVASVVVAVILVAIYARIKGKKK